MIDCLFEAALVTGSDTLNTVMIRHSPQSLMIKASVLIISMRMQWRIQGAPTPKVETQITPTTTTSWLRESFEMKY